MADASQPPPDSSTMLPRLQSALRAFQASHKPFALIPTAASTTTTTTPRKCKTLVILDSSFNPPTIAHMAMATSALYDLHTQRDIAGALRGGDAAPTATTHKHQGDDDGGVRLLLLLAVNNADKAAKPATFEQRLLMMEYFAKDIQRAWRRRRREEEAQSQAQAHVQAQAQAQAQEEADEGELPVDIGLTTHPYFHDKSAAIAASPEYEFTPSSSEQVFLAGYDTLIRIFNPKYYTTTASAPDDATTTTTTTTTTTKTPMQTALDPFLARSRLRITMRTDAEWGGRAEQEAFVEGLLKRDELERSGGRREWAKLVAMVAGLEGEEGLVLSSTEARAAVEKGDWERLRRLVPEGVAGMIERGEVEW